MPDDVMIGYTALDSLCKIATKDDLNARALAMTEDSLRIGYQYLYSVMDYDPILFRIYSERVSADTSYTSAVIDVIDALYRGYSQYVQWDSCDAAALWTPYVYHIRLENIASYLDVHGFDNETSIRHYCGSALVLNKFKGVITPDTSFYSDNPREYVTLRWSRNEPDDPSRIWDSTRYNARGHEYMDVGREYFVFMRPNSTISSICSDAYYLAPAIHSSEMGYWFMPVENGFVYDETNFFKMGEYIPLERFDSYLMNVYQRL